MRGLVALLFLHVAQVHGVIDYCSIDRFNLSTPFMEFTKSPSNREFATAGMFKSLHCCAQGYTSIEWYRDGKPYPWPADVTNFILYPKSENQTIYTPETVFSESANFTCVVRNTTSEIRHSINFNVLEGKSYTGYPLPTHAPKDHAVSIGEDVRFFCEAFVGKIEIPDAENEVNWFFHGNETAIEINPRMTKIDAPRSDEQILGSYLFISDVQEEDLGEYTCQISNTQSQTVEMPLLLREKGTWEHPAPTSPNYKRFILIFVITIFSSLALILIYMRFNLQIQLFVMNNFHRPENDDGKDYDVLVCYDEKDSEFVLGVLVPTLENRHHYKCISQAFMTPAVNNNWEPELHGIAQRSRRLLAVLSPALFTNNWNSNSLCLARQTLLRIHNSVICITLQALPHGDHIKPELAKSLRSVPCIEWQGSSEQNRKAFWNSLCLKLPVRKIKQLTNKQPMTHVTAVGVGTGVKKRSLRSNSVESLEVLV